MKIAFWSPVHGQTGTTSNMLAVALTISLAGRKRCLLTQTHFNFNNLEAPLVGSNSKNTASSDYFRDVGLDALIRNFKSCKLNRDILDNCCVTFQNTNISLLPGTSKSNKDSFEYEMNNVLLNLLRTMEELTGILFIDICSGDNPLSLKIIADSDLTVVNLSQNIGMIDTFLNNNKETMQKKVFFLMGNYDRQSKYNLQNLRRRYWKQISVLNSGTIPYNANFLDAMNDGKVIEFLKANLGCEKEDENYYFIQQVRKAADKILKITGFGAGTQVRIKEDGDIS
jgi:hypothetical protein